MGKGTEGRPLMIRSLETGAERELPLKPSLRYYQWPRWSPDGRSILVAGRDQEVYGLFSIDVESGAVSRVVRILSDNAVSPSPSWSPDGKAVFYLQRDDAHPELTVIKRRDLASGAEKAVHRGLLGQTQLSPDGRQFAFIQRSSASQSSILAVMEVGGGESRELARIQPQDRVTDLVWTSDSRYVLFARSLKDQASEIWRAPTTGGQAERITALDGRVNGLKVHPNGRLLGIELLRYKNELWALENYLSPPGPVRQQR
jgi:Tol biopolymer transport system component